MPAPLSWYAVPMKRWDMKIEPLVRVRSTMKGRMTAGSWTRKWIVWA